MNRKRIFVIALALLALCACNLSTHVEIIGGSGNVVREARAVEGIKGVTLATLGDLTIEVGSEEALTIEAEDNLLPHLETVVRGGILTIGTESGVSLIPTEEVHYYLTVKNLDSLSVTSSGDIEAPSLQATDFKMKSSSSGDIHLARLDASSVDVEINSSGDIMIDEGQVQEQEVSIRSSGVYMADEVQCERADVEIRSSGNATIWATERIDANLSSSGNVNYYGDAGVSQSTSSSGRVVSLGER